ncbi:MAG TPA: carbohydrate ABC transporter permease [Candidatus Faecaligallichristensenella faecipullorum]|nr:carbohydrate ABC transporter permease [Candidatus Faecaligallichristensenella faecipullorum]
MSKGHIRQTSGDRTFSVVVYILLTLVGISVLYPLVYVLSASFSDSTAVVSGRVWLLPVDFTTIAYEQVMKNKNIISGYANSILYALGGTAVSMVLSVLAGYGLSRKNLVGKGIINRLFIFATLFSGGLIPFYLVIKSLGMVNTRWAIIIPNALNVFHIMLMRTSIQTGIPEEMLEAADIDGCNHFQKLLILVIPLSGSMLAVLALYGIVGQWNSYFNALMFLNDYDLYPLQIILRDILIMNTMDIESITDISALELKQGLADIMKYALIVVSSAPLILIYPFVQRFFVKGVMVGSMKG